MNPTNSTRYYLTQPSSQFANPKKEPKKVDMFIVYYFYSLIRYPHSLFSLFIISFNHPKEDLIHSYFSIIHVTYNFNLSFNHQFNEGLIRIIIFTRLKGSNIFSSNPLRVYY